MSRTQQRQDFLYDSDAYDDTKTTGATMESAPTTLANNLDDLRTMLKTFSGSSDWFLAPADQAGDEDFQSIKANARKMFAFRNNVIVNSGITVSGGQTFEILGAGEFPTFNSSLAAVDDGSVVVGSVVAFHTGTFGTWSGATVTGTDVLNPCNMVEIVEESTRDPIISTSGVRIYGLIQSEVVTDGQTINSTTQRVQLSFVQTDIATNTLIECPVTADIAGKTIQYANVVQDRYQDLPKGAFLNGLFADAIGDNTVNLTVAAVNQSGIVVPGDKEIDWQVFDGRHFDFEDDAGNLLARFAVDGGGTNVTQQFGNATSATSVTSFEGTGFDSNVTGTADFLQGLAVDTGDQTINIGVTATGQIDSTSVTIDATSGALTLDGTTGIAIDATGNGAAITLNTANNASGVPGAIVNTAGNAAGTGSGDVGGAITNVTGDGALAAAGTAGAAGGTFSVTGGAGGVALEAVTTGDDAGAGALVALIGGVGGAADGTDTGGNGAGDAAAGGAVTATAGAGGAASGGTVAAGAGGDGGKVTSTGGIGGAGSDNTVDGQPGNGGDIELFAGPGGPGVGTTDNGDGADVVARSGAAGTGGSGAAGLFGTVRLVSQTNHLHEVVQIENTDATIQQFTGTGNPDTVVTALQGSVYFSTNGSVYVNDDGATSWAALSTGSVETLSDVVGNVGTSPALMSDNFVWEVTEGDTLQFRTDTGDFNLLSLAAETGGQDTVVIGNVDTGTKVTVNTGTGGFDVNTTGVGTIDLNSTNAVTINAAAASNLSVAGANLTLETTSSGDVVVNAVDNVDMDSGSNIAITAGTGLNIDAGTAIAMDAGTAADASTHNVGITGGVSTAASNAAPAVTVTAGTPGAGGAAAPVTLALPATNIDSDDAVVSINNAGAGGHAFNIYSRDVAADPDTVVLAPAGSLLVNVNAATTPELWLNDTSGTGSGMDWVRMATLDDILASNSLQEAYVVDNVVTVTSGEGTLDFSNSTSTDTTDVLTVTRAPGASTAGEGIVVSMNGNTTGVGVQIGSAGSGTALEVDATGAGATVDFQTGGASVFAIGAAGNVAVTPVSGENIVATVGGAGIIDLNAGAGGITVDAVAGAISLDAGLASNFTVAGAALTLESTGAFDVNVTGGGAVSIQSGTTDIGLVATTSVDLTAGTTVGILSGGGDDVDITAGENIDMAGETIRFDGPADYGHEHWASEYHMFGGVASAHENYLTINAQPVPSSTLDGGLCVITSATTYTDGQTISGSTAQSAANAFFTVNGTPGVAAGDFIVAEGCVPEAINGLWQVAAVSSGVIEVVGFAASPIDGMFKEDMPTDAGATGSLYKADICVLRCSGGTWEVASGDNVTALVYTAISTASTLEGVVAANTGATTAFATSADLTVDEGDVYSLSSTTGGHAGFSFSPAAAGDSFVLGTDDGGAGTGAVTSGSGGLSLGGGATGAVNIDSGLNANITIDTADGSAVLASGGVLISTGNQTNAISTGNINLVVGTITTGFEALGESPGDVNITAGRDVNGVFTTLGGGDVNVTAGEGGFGGTVYVTGGADSGGGIGGGGVVVTGGLADASGGTGGIVTTSGGAGVGTTNGGAVTSTGGDSGVGATGNGGSNSVYGGAAVSTNGNGGTVNVEAGVLAGTGFDGDIIIGGVTVNTVRIGLDGAGGEIATNVNIGATTSLTGSSEGTVTFTAGAAGASSNATFATGSSTSGVPGTVNITAGFTTNAGSDGGALNVDTGAGGDAAASTTGGAGGGSTYNGGAGGDAFQGTTGTEADAGLGGVLSFTSGPGGPGSGSDTGANSAGHGGAGANFNITAGFGGAGDAGTTEAADAGPAGDVLVTAGAAGIGAGTGNNGDGGSVYLTATPGDVTGSGTAGVDGHVAIQSNTGLSTEILRLDRTGTSGVTTDLYNGSVDPEAAVTANAGNFYFRDSGTSSLTNALYVKGSGDGTNTGWERVQTRGSRQKLTAVVTAATVAADTDVSLTTAANLDADLVDYSSLTSAEFVTHLNIYVNGALMRNGVNAAANNDVYPGTTSSIGQLKFEFTLRQDDVITMEAFL